MINSFSFKGISVILIFCLLFEMRCATTRKLPVSSFDHKELMDEELIILTLINGQKYEVSDFIITDTHIVGTFILIDKYGEQKKAENIKMIQFEEIAYIQLNPYKFTPPPKSCIRAIACIGVLILIILFIGYSELKNTDWSEGD